MQENEARNKMNQAINELIDDFTNEDVSFEDMKQIMKSFGMAAIVTPEACSAMITHINTTICPSPNITFIN